MSLGEEMRQAEQRLRGGFKNSLDSYSQWEGDSKERLLDSLYGEDEEEEEEEEE